MRYIGQTTLCTLPVFDADGQWLETETKIRIKDLPEAVRQAKLFQAPVLQHQYTVLTADVVRALHENQVAVWSWTTNDEPSLVFSIEAGADGIMSDDAQLMLETLNYLKPVDPGSVLAH